MAIYSLEQDALTPLSSTGFESEGIYERQDLQRLLKARIDALGENLMVIAEEFGEWTDSYRRIDLLCIDTSANLVVVELKRTQDGGHMELQALRYAAMVSAMKWSQLVSVYQRYEGKELGDECEQKLLDFLGWDSPQLDEFNQNVNIVLASADFSRELTTTVLWLLDQGLDIRCVRLRPYRSNEGKIFLDIQPLIPLPEASAYQTQLREREREEKQQRSVESNRRELFWQGFAEQQKEKFPQLARRPLGSSNWLLIERYGENFSLYAVIRANDSSAELYIERGDESYDLLMRLKALIEPLDGELAELNWIGAEGTNTARVQLVGEGGINRPDAEWPAVYRALSNATASLHRLLKPSIDQLLNEPN